MAMQALVIAHAAYGHNSFFKGNYLFKLWTDAHAIIDYLVYGRDDFEEAPHWVYPCGDERAELNELMTTYFERHRQELTRRLVVTPRHAPSVPASFTASI